MIRRPGTVYTQGERSRPSRAERLAPGDVVGGHYEVQELLDEGGMAVVYRAVNTATGKACALKILHAQLGDRPEFVRLFAKEAKVSSVVGDNVHVVQVYDAGLDNERGIPFIVMELLDGETLERLLEHGPLTPELVRHLLPQLESALTQAHAAGVVHRDMKPSNIFIASDKHGDPLLKVMDFGIAKVMEGEAIRTATQVGTPAYNAPEQMGSTTRKLAAKQGIVIASGVSPQTDIWALGLLAYEMFTGDLPGMYWGVQTLSELPMKVAFEEHETASSRAGRNAALLPEGFDKWFSRCLRKNAEERWGSAAEAIEELLKLIDDTPILVNEEELETVSTRLFAPPKKSSTPGRSVAKSARDAASDPPPLPRISSPAISERSMKAAQEAIAAKNAEAAEADDKEMASSDGPMVKDNDKPTPARAKPEQPSSGLTFSPMAGFAVIALSVGALAAYGVAKSDDSSKGPDTGKPAVTSTAGPVSSAGCNDEGATVSGCKDACETGALASCERLGGMLAKAKGDAKDVPGALAAFSKACGVPVLAPEKRRDWSATVEGDGCANGQCLPQACTAAADLYRHGGDGVLKDERAATSLYKRVCRVGQPQDGPARGAAGCVGLGEQRVRAGETAAARGFFEAACDDGLSSGCVALASVLERGDGKGEARDEKRARALYDKACNGGDLEGCTRLGHMVERGRGGWVRDQEAAVALYKRACDGGQLLGCMHLADAYLKAKGKLTRDAVRAVELIQNSCDAGEPAACAELAVMVRDGVGGLTRDQKRAFTLNKKACDDGAARACLQLGEMYIEGAAGLTKDPVEGRTLIERACRQGDALGCIALARIDADKLSAEERQQLLQRACDGGEPVACSELGELIEQGGEEADAERAVKLYQKACDDGAMRACTNLANLTYQGVGGLERDAKRSVELNAMACNGGDMVGCTRLGMLYALGQGIDQDTKKANDLYAKACKGDLTEQMQSRCQTLKTTIDKAGKEDKE